MADAIELLEREPAINQILARIDAAAGGAGSVLVLDGEAGSGKTSVISAVRGRVPANTDVLVGYCDPLTTPRPFGPLRDVVASHRNLAHLAEALDTPHEAFGELLDHLRRSIRPILLVIEDLHWADDSTLDMVTFIGRRIESTRAVMLLSVRGGELEPGNRVGVTLSSLMARTTTVRRIEMEPLSTEAIEELAVDRRAEAASIRRITGGNAFFVTEILATDDALPSTVQDAVLARLGRLSAPARTAAEVVSIAPRSVERRHLMTLTRTSGYVVDEAIYAGVLVGEGDAYRFRHELARLAVEESIPDPRRIDLHRRMLDLLIEDGSTDVSRLAHHSVRVGDRDLILRFAPIAAREAAIKGSKREAASFFDAAGPLLDSLTADEQVQLLIEYANALIDVDRQVDALEATRRALDVAEADGDPGLIADALLAHDRATWLNGDAQGSGDLIARAIRLRQPQGDSPELANALYRAGSVEMLDRHRDAAIELSSRALEMARRIGSGELETLGLLGLGTAELVVGDPDRGIELLETALSMAEDDSTQTSILSMLGTGGGEVKRYDAALAWLVRAIELGTAHDADYGIAYATAWMSRIRAEQGHWDEALQLAEQVTSLPPEVARISPVTALGTVGRIQARQGNANAISILNRSVELGRRGAIQHIWVPLCATAEYYIYRDEPAAAIAVLRDPLERILDTDTLWGRGEIAYWMWMAGRLDPVPDRLAEPYARMISGDWQRAAAMWDEIGAPYEAAMARSAGPPEAALEALAVFDRLGARPMAQRVRHRLRSDGVRGVPRGPSGSTVADPLGLTNRQREVLELMAGGLSNKEIADRLFVSRKTVENHVSAVLGKLDATTRDEAVMRARDLRS